MLKLSWCSILGLVCSWFWFLVNGSRLCGVLLSDIFRYSVWLVVSGVGGGRIVLVDMLDILVVVVMLDILVVLVVVGVRVVNSVFINVLVSWWG